MEVTRDPGPAITNLPRHGRLTARSSLGAAWMEGATGRRLERIGKGNPKPGVGHAEAGFGREHGGEQRPSVGMARRAAQRPGPPLPDRAASIAHRYSRRDMIDHGEVEA